MQLGAMEKFQRTVWTYYDRHGRHELPWRLPAPDGRFDPYKILVSEVMLQQTQVGRVIPKYQQFVERFPTLKTLAGAPLGEILIIWSGLGYNRRAQFLRAAAQEVFTTFHGQFPSVTADLVRLPGVGRNTAGAILAYAFNQPAIFLETNIRTVFIHHFFRDQAAVPDAAILELVAQTLDTENPRSWYWALMDYGSHLKQTVGNLNRSAQAYAKQSPFAGSRRQIRGQVLRLLTERTRNLAELRAVFADPRLDEVLRLLEREGLIGRSGDTYYL